MQNKAGRKHLLPDGNIFKGTHFGYSVTEANPECRLAVAVTLLQLAEFSIGACLGGVGRCANLAEKGVLLLLLLLVVAGDDADAIARQVRRRQAESRSRFPRATLDAILRNGWAGEHRVRLDHYAVRSADALGRVEGRGVEALEAEVTDRITLAVHNASYQAVGEGGTGHEG